MARKEYEEWEVVEEEFTHLMSKMAKRKLTREEAHEFNRGLLHKQRAVEEGIGAYDWMVTPQGENGMYDRTKLLEQLDALAARLESEGQYVDANIAVNAYIELCGAEPPTWWAQILRDGWTTTSSANSESE